MPIETICLRRDVQVGGSTYPVYMAFLSAEELDKVAQVPSFSERKKHHEIAAGLRQLPIGEWQRPVDEERVNAIAKVFSDANSPNLMANPVLLGNAPGGQPRIQILPLTVGSGMNNSVVPGVSRLLIGDVSPLGDRPLWVLDGQHRIKGLLASTQKTQPIPVVLLLDDALYPSHFLAKMFTQVTTEARPMRPLHGEWMSYAFEMGRYAQAAWQSAMRATIELCSSSAFDGTSNEFLNLIQFNPYDSQWKGFQTIKWDVKAWNELIAVSYYGAGGTLAPPDLATQIVRFLRAVFGLDVYKEAKSKLTNADHGNPLIIEGFVRHFLRFLADPNKGASLQSNTQTEWQKFLQDPRRKFSECNWQMNWIRTTGSTSGAAYDPSKHALDLAFDRFFNDPDKLSGLRLPDYLRGPDRFTLVAYSRNQSGNLLTARHLRTALLEGHGGTQSVAISE